MSLVSRHFEFQLLCPIDFAQVIPVNSGKEHALVKSNDDTSSHEFDSGLYFAKKEVCFRLPYLWSVSVPEMINYTEDAADCLPSITDPRTLYYATGFDWK